MVKEAISLARSPEDTVCADPACGVPIGLGAFAYVNSETKEVLCLECGVKRGWSSKQRVKQILTLLELKEDIKALKEQRKVLADGLLMLKKQIDLFRLGERDLELEKQILTLTTMAQEYMRIGTSEEKEALQKLRETVREAQDVQKEIREYINNRLYWFETKPKKRKQEAQIA